MNKVCNNFQLSKRIKFVYVRKTTSFANSPPQVIFPYQVVVELKASVLLTSIVIKHRKRIAEMHLHYVRILKPISLQKSYLFFGIITLSEKLFGLR